MIRTTILSTFAAATMMFSSVAHADCFDDAAAYQKVNPTMLRGIQHVENAPGNPKAIGRNKNGSVDYGLMQINSIHLPELKKHGIRRKDLMNSCKNIYVAAWLLRRSMNRYGNNWAAAGGYHSDALKERAKYAAKVQKAVKTILAAKQQKKQSVQLAAKPQPARATLLASN